MKKAFFLGLFFIFPAVIYVKNFKKREQVAKNRLAAEQKEIDNAK